MKLIIFSDQGLCILVINIALQHEVFYVAVLLIIYSNDNVFTHTHTCRAFLNEAMVSSSCLFLDVWLWHKFPSFIQFKTSKVYSFKVVCNTCTKKKKEKLICELSVQCELHNDFIVNTVDNSNLFW